MLIVPNLRTPRGAARIKMGRGKSYGITLPISAIRNLGWKERQKLVVTQKGKRLIIEDWRNRLAWPICRSVLKYTT